MSEQDQTAHDVEYEAIEEAIMQNPRGRWFLNEYARRNRAADTDRLVDAIERLYRTAVESRTIPDTDSTATTINLEVIRRALGDMRQQINATRNEMAAIKPRDSDHFGNPEDNASAVATSAEQATRDIHSAVERLQEIADALRAKDVDDDICDEIETHARGIFMSSAYQDLTGQRISHLMMALTALDSRIGGILALEAFSDD
jgi:chemotaxis regulatin CheY-phosphate phosphatase CheZ